MDYELPWSGESFSAPILAFDTETAVHRPDGSEYDLQREIPPFVLATVSDGSRSAVIHPDQLSDFVSSHACTLLVGHNIQFDYWVVKQGLESRYGYPSIIWGGLPDRGLMDDTMLLEYLVRLFTNHIGERNVSGDFFRNLGEVAGDYGYTADKGSDYRLRFGEIVGKDWSTVDRGFFDYAVQDSVVTLHIYNRLCTVARQAVDRAGVDLELVCKYGLLTSKLQTRSSIVLADISRRGIALDRPKVSQSVSRIQERVWRLIGILDLLEPNLFGTWKTRTKKGVKHREFVRSLDPKGKSGLPSMSTENLTEHLLQAARDEKLDVTSIPRSDKKGNLSLSAEEWLARIPDHSFVRLWAELKEAQKTLELLNVIRDKDSVHPRFRTIMRTGRTSCYGPNLQQVPRESWFRGNFIARPGQVFVIADYSAIELVTLAAVLEDRHRKGLGPESVLARVLKEGRKPHEYTAALVAGTSYKEMVSGVKREKAEGVTGPFSKNRQAAKAINFGVPGGLGKDKLSTYARNNYGVEMSPEEAKEFRRQLIEEVYPELLPYLFSNDLELIAANLQCDIGELDRALRLNSEQERTWLGQMVANVVGRGGKRKSDGKMYPLSFRTKVWSALQRLNNNPALVPALESWRSTPLNMRSIVGRPVATLTGRVRGGADYTEARNTPFQGLAADGAKVALWKIQRAGYKIVHFVHDEIVVECTQGRAEEVRRDVVRLMQEGMVEVLQTDIPVEVEAVVSKTWTK